MAVIFLGDEDITSNKTFSSKIQPEDDPIILKEDTYDKRLSSNSIYKLKTKIDELAESIKEKENRLSAFDVSVSSKTKAIDEITIKINALETKLSSAWFGKEKIRKEHNALVQSHNNILELHNNELSEYRILYEEYNRELNAYNKLVKDYNYKIRQ